MNRRRVLRWLLGTGGVIGLGWAFLASGLYDVSATAKTSGLERGLAHYAVDHSVERRAPKGPNPVVVTPEVITRGLHEYQHHCMVCHGVPGEVQSGIAAGLNPPPPDLADPDTQESSDGELFQVISAGIRMTGMPAFSRSESEETIWKLVAFVRHLPKLTDDEKRELTARTGRPEPAERPAGTP